MMLQMLLIIGAALGGLTVIVQTIGANIYDVREANRRLRRQAHPGARRYRRRPSITVMVPAHNNADSIERCLQALVNTRYRQLQVIVADNVSEDNTKRLVRQFAASHLRLELKLFAKRQPVDPVTLVSQAYTRYATGDLILICSPENWVDSAAFRKIAYAFIEETDVQAATLRQSTQPDLTLTSLLQKYHDLLQHRREKWQSLLGYRQHIELEGTVFRSTSFKQALEANRAYKPHSIERWQYLHDAVVRVPSRATYLSWLSQQGQRTARLIRQARPPRSAQRWQYWAAMSSTGLGALAGLSAPLIISYFAYLAFRLHEPRLFFASLSAVAVLFLLSIWGDEALRGRQKLGYSLGIPLTYGAFYGLSLVQIATVGSTLWRLGRRSLAS